MVCLGEGTAESSAKEGCKQKTAEQARNRWMVVSGGERAEKQARAGDPFIRA